MGFITCSALQGLLALLEEEEPVLQAHALKQLHAVIDQHWVEVASSVTKIEELSEDTSFEVGPRVFACLPSHSAPRSHTVLLVHPDPNASFMNLQLPWRAAASSTWRSTMTPCALPSERGSTSMWRPRGPATLSPRTSTSRPWCPSASVLGPSLWAPLLAHPLLIRAPAAHGALSLSLSLSLSSIRRRVYSPPQ